MRDVGTLLEALPYIREFHAAISLGRSAVTRLDGEWWMGHHIEAFP